MANRDVSVIRVEQVTFEYPGFRALDDISFEIPPNQVVALVGPNGAGKTTLMRCICGLERPIAGEIHIDGINVIVDQEHIKGKMDDVVEEIRALLKPDKVKIVPELALIAIVGEGMNHSIGISARTFTSLARAQVNVQVINQGASEVNIIVGVSPSDFNPAVNALYAEFVKSQRVSSPPPAN